MGEIRNDTKDAMIVKVTNGQEVHISSQTSYWSKIKEGVIRCNEGV